jgi:23S rRNA pseudouridine1911/1915/1917 synthase
MTTGLPTPECADGVVTVPDEAEGVRLDRFLTDCFPLLSRSRIQRDIRLGLVSVDGVLAPKTGIPLRGGMELAYAPLQDDPSSVEPVNLPLKFLHVDEDIIVLSKPAALVVHPAAGTHDPTLVHALLFHFPDLAELGGDRPGIVHRLDRGTSGVMVVARTARAREALAEQFMARTVFKGYLTVVLGSRRQEEGCIERPIQRHPTDRKRFSSIEPGGRPAVTLWRTLASGEFVSLLSVRILTGRTHQIRVHLADEGFPVLGDPTYGVQRQLATRKLVTGDLLARGTMLHAAHLAFRHPVSGRPLTFEDPPPDDFRSLCWSFLPDMESLWSTLTHHATFPEGSRD